MQSMFRSSWSVGSTTQLIALGLSMLLVGSCSREPHRTQDANRADNYVKLQLCEKGRPDCDGRFRTVGPHGVTVGIWTNSRACRLSPLAERPTGSAPDDDPLIHLDAIEGEPGDARRSNWYALSRVRLLQKDNVPLLTTSRGWPIVACGENLINGVSCTLGLVVEGRFVEAHFASSTGRIPSQREVWELGSAIEETVRSQL